MYIIRGEPYRSGTLVHLTDDKTLIGRASTQTAPDIAFANAFISRRHAVIHKDRDRAVLYDMGSRHGTEINGVRLMPHTPYDLKNFDIIKLARGMTVMHFSYLFAEQTLELEPLSLTNRMAVTEQAVTIHWERRECAVDGKRILLSDKEFLLLRLLHEQVNRLVPLEQIKATVWPERMQKDDGVPDVTLDELNALLYRVRKKFGKDTLVINAVRGVGYMLETELKSE